MPHDERSKLRILIAEDDFMVRQVIRDVLEHYGVVDIVVNGEEAVQAFRVAWRQQQPYDLICMDIMMPIMDGNEALVKIREMENSLGIVGSEEVKVIMISALDDAKTVVKAYFNGGATSYIVKPIEKERLISEMRNIGLLAP
ncbi:MAG: response regulator [Desulfobulbaceae bacterium]|nr:response regulator [Desulfobulbaceae bacterium]